MAISSGTILRVVASMLLPDSVIAQNIFYTVVTDLVTSDDELDVVLDIGDWLADMYTQLASTVVDDVTASDYKVYEYDPIDDDWDEVGSDTWDDAFINSQDMVPHGVAGVCHAKSLDPDVQATKFLPGFGELGLTASDLSAGTISDMADFCDSWVTEFIGTATGGTFGPGVWSTPQEVFKLFSGVFVINGVAGYQRRRKPGVGI